MDRRDTDMAKLMRAGYTVVPIKESIHKFHVYFNGPPDSLYSGGVWKIVVNLIDEYPYESPLIHFMTPIYHPNIQLPGGGISVDLLEDQWVPTFDLVTVFDLILPQLLMEPNPSYPYNKYAARLLLKDRSAYEEKVKEYRDRCATAKPGQ